MYGFSFNIMNKKRTIKSTLNVTCLEARVERVILSMMTYILLFSMILKCRQKRWIWFVVLFNYYYCFNYACTLVFDSIQ